MCINERNRNSAVPHAIRMNDIKICNGSDLVSLDQDFIQGSSTGDISLTDIRKDGGIPQSNEYAEIGSQVNLRNS
jgi:hypothetical protein